MKTLAHILLAALIMVSCSKIDTAFEAPHEISFEAVAGNITKAPVSGTSYPTSLNLYVNAYTADISADATTPNYFINGEFKYIRETEEYVSVWGGWNSATNKANPYYWPNVKTLHFSGYSKSGNIGANVNPASASYNPQTDALTINDYNPGIGAGLGANDLMYFPSTKHTNSSGYGADTKYVTVNMYHTCSWISFFVKGDEVTGDGKTYSVTNMYITELFNTANVTCSADVSTIDNEKKLTPEIEWTDYDNKGTYLVNVYENGVTLFGNAKNVETNEAYSSTNKFPGENIVVIPQVPGKLNLIYKYGDIEKTVENLDLTYAKDDKGNSIPWQPGKHYIYTITIKANEILIAPNPIEWKDSNWNVTVE